MAYLISAIPIKGEALTAKTYILWVSANHLQHTLKAAKEWQAGGMQAHHDLVVRDGLLTVTNHNQGPIVRQSIISTVRHEGGGWVMPQQLIHGLRGGLVRGTQHHAQSLLNGQVAKVASGTQFVTGPGVKIYLGHQINILVRVKLWGDR